MIEECLAVEFRVTGDECPLADAADSVGVAIDCEPPQRRADDYALLRFTAPRSDRLAATLDADDRIRYLHRSSGESRDEYRCLSKQRCVVHRLTDVGFLAETLRYERGSERFRGAVVGHDVLRGVLDVAGENGGVSLEHVYPLHSENGGVVGRFDVTPAQGEALKTALAMGYFEVPKRSTASDVAESLGISKTAFLERLRRGQRGLLEDVFGDE
ncbi:MAG: helix-turn-helix domain-containing protein [Halobacteriota archaeon]